MRNAEKFSVLLLFLILAVGAWLAARVSAFFSTGQWYTNVQDLARVLGEHGIGVMFWVVIVAALVVGFSRPVSSLNWTISSVRAHTRGIKLACRTW